MMQKRLFSHRGQQQTKPATGAKNARHGHGGQPDEQERRKDAATQNNRTKIEQADRPAVFS